MSLRLQSQLFIDNLPDEQNDAAFEVVMPTLKIGIQSDTLTSLSNKYGNWVGELLGRDYTPIVEEIKFGVRNFGSNTRRVRTGWLNVPDDIENMHDAQITMFCSNEMITQYYMEAWKKLIFNEDGEYYNHMNKYKKNIEVYFYGLGNIGAGIPVSAHYTLVGCFPITQTDYTLKYTGSPKRLTITATFKVDKIIFDQKYMKSSIIQEVIEAPLALGDRALSYLAGDPAAYDIFKKDVYGYSGMSD